MRKIALIFVMIFLICCMTACKNKGTVQETSSITNTKNTSNTESSNVETTVEETKPSYNLIDKSRDDLSDSEKKQLKYYNDGYTFIAQLSYDQKWLLYKYGELYKVIDASDFYLEKKDKFKDAYADGETIGNYIVMDNYLYFFISKTKDVCRINLDDCTIQTYIDGSEFEDYAVYDNSIMLKHKKKLVFICTCEEWNNIVEVDTTKSTPKLEYKGKCDTVTIPGDEWNQFNFIPIDEDNYRITEYKDGIVSDLTAYCSYNFSLKDYKITDVVNFPNIEYDEDNWQDYVDEESLGYFYRDNKDILFSYILKSDTNDISGRTERSCAILKSNSNGNKDLLNGNVGCFTLKISYTVDKISQLNSSKLSEDWFLFNEEGKDLIYFFDDNELYEIDGYVSYADLWNVYLNQYDENTKLNYISKPIRNLKSNIYTGNDEI